MDDVDIVQMAIPLLIAYICFSNPMLVTGSLFVYFFMLLLVGWIGFFYGMFIFNCTNFKNIILCMHCAH